MAVILKSPTAEETRGKQRKEKGIRHEKKRQDIITFAKFTSLFKLILKD